VRSAEKLPLVFVPCLWREGRLVDPKTACVVVLVHWTMESSSDEHEIKENAVNRYGKVELGKVHLTLELYQLLDRR